MPVPSSRTPVRIARGTYANLSTTAALEALALGEVCFATDEDRLYMRTLGGLTAISSTNETAPTPAQVTASPAFTGGTGTQADPYLITNVGSPFSGGSLTSAHEITISGTAGDIAVFTDNSPTASADRFKGQDVGILNAAGEFKLNLKYTDNPGTTTDNTTYTGNLQIGTAHITWVVVQSNLTQLSEDTATTISGGTGVGDTVTAVAGTATGGTASYTSEIKWQRSFTGIDGFFDTGSTGANYTITSADAGYYVRAVTTVTDSTDAAQGGPLTIELASAASAQLNTNQVTTVNSLTLSEDNTSGARYTSQSYSLDAVLNPDGTPTSTKNVKVKLEGTFDVYPQTDTVSSTTSGDPIANNVNQNSLDIQNSGGGTGGNDYRNWHAPLFIHNDTDQGFLNFTTHHSSYQDLRMYFTRTKGMGSDEAPYSGDAISNDGSNSELIDGRYLWKPTWDSTNYNQWYQTQSGSNSSQTMYMAKLYKSDTLMIYGSNGGFMYLKDIIANKDDWQKHWTPVKDYQYPGGGGSTSGYTMDFVDIGDVRYNVFVSGHSTSGYIAVVTGDLTDPVNQTSTEVPIAWMSSPYAPSGASGSADPQQIFTHGSKVTIVVRYSVSSVYHFRFFTCDFSVNDGSDASHWVFKHDLKNANQGAQTNMGPGTIAVNPQNSDQIYLFLGTATASNVGYYYSADGGETYSSRPTPVVSGWTLGTGISGVIWHRNRILLVAGLYATWNGNGTGGSGTSQHNNRFWCFVQSSDTGNNWTVALYNGGYAVGYYGTYNSGPAQLLDSRYFDSLIENGGWIFAPGKFYYSNTTSYNYRMGMYVKDKDTVNLSGSTNLSNSSIKINDVLIQPGSNPPVSGRLTHISGSTLTFTNMSGQTTFEDGLALQNTVSYFGGSQATLYALLSGAGAVTDLTSSDPGFVNLGYGVDNTITFPGTFPSGNTPDVELPAGTTIQATVQFTNSQGTVTADSNTLTPQ